MEEPRPTTAYALPNGMLMVFDQHGKQMPGLQGLSKECIEKVRAAGYTGRSNGESGWFDGRNALHAMDEAGPIGKGRPMGDDPGAILTADILGARIATRGCGAQV